MLNAAHKIDVPCGVNRVTGMYETPNRYGCNNGVIFGEADPE
jgi:hypothetical protein